MQQTPCSPQKPGCVSAACAEHAAAASAPACWPLPGVPVWQPAGPHLGQGPPSCSTHRFSHVARTASAGSGCNSQKLRTANGALPRKLSVAMDRYIAGISTTASGDCTACLNQQAAGCWKPMCARDHCPLLRSAFSPGRAHSRNSAHQESQHFRVTCPPRAWQALFDPVHVMPQHTSNMQCRLL